MTREIEKQKDWGEEKQRSRGTRQQRIIEIYYINRENEKKGSREVEKWKIEKMGCREVENEESRERKRQK